MNTSFASISLSFSVFPYMYAHAH